MPKVKTHSSRMRAAPAATPQMPPPSAEEQAQTEELVSTMRNTIEILRQRNLETAVQLAVMASRRQLPRELEEHFGELGRRYAELARDGKPARRSRAAGLRLATIAGAEVGK